MIIFVCASKPRIVQVIVLGFDFQQHLSMPQDFSCIDFTCSWIWPCNVAIFSSATQHDPHCTMPGQFQCILIFGNIVLGLHMYMCCSKAHSSTYVAVDEQSPPVSCGRIVTLNITATPTLRHILRTPETPPTLQLLHSHCHFGTFTHVPPLPTSLSRILSFSTLTPQFCTPTVVLQHLHSCTSNPTI